MSYRFPISSHLTPGVQPHCWWSIWHHRTHRCHFGQLSLPVNYRSPWFQNQKTMILSCNSLITYGWWSRSHLHVGVYKGCNFLAKMANLTKSCTNSSDTVFVFSSPRVWLHLGHLSGQFPLFWFQSVVYKWSHHYLRIASHLVACFNLLNTQTSLKWSIKEVQNLFDILLNCILHINSNLSEDVGLIFSFGCWSRNYLKSLLRSCETSVWQDPPKNQTDSEFFSSQIHLSMKGLVILSRALLHQSHQAAIYQQGSNIMIVNPPPTHPPSGTLQTGSNTSSRKGHICYARDIFEHLYQMWI